MIFCFNLKDISLIFTHVVYVLISILAIAAIPRGIFIKMPNPSVAYALQYAVGTWGAVKITIGLIISIVSSIYGFWVIYASGLNLLLICTILFAIGLIFYIYARVKIREKFSLKLNGFSFI